LSSLLTAGQRTVVRVPCHRGQCALATSCLKPSR
jgi:hypothetical protein